MIFGKIVCFFKGHKRGKEVPTPIDSPVSIFRCPRCGHETRYKVKQS